MGETLGRIKSWVQEHPWLTAGIVLVAVVVGYIVYKRSQTGQPMATQGVPATSDTTTGATQPSTSGGDITIPPALSAPTLSGGGSSGAGGQLIQIPGSSFGVPSPDMSGAYASLGMPSPSVPSASGLPADLSTLTLNQLAGGGAPITLGTLFGSGYPSIGSAPVTLGSISTSTPKARGGGNAQTPAQQVGKGRLFTGFFQGVQYNLGYPVGTPTTIVGSNAPAIVSAPQSGGGTIVSLLAGPDATRVNLGPNVTIRK